MKKLFVLLTVFVSGFATMAQKNSPAGAGPSFILSLNGGIASPMGNFAKSDYADDASGFAKTGGHFNLTGIYSISRHFGIGALIGYSRYGFKGTQSLADGYKEDSGTDSTTLYTKGNNHSLQFLIGPSYRLEAGKKITLEVRALGGYVNTHLAGFTIFYEDYTDNALTQKEASAGAFGFQGGLGVQYHLTDKFSVQVNGDYFTSTPRLSVSYDHFIVNSGRRLTTYNESLSGINATIGLACRLF